MNANILTLTWVLLVALCLFCYLRRVTAEPNSLTDVFITEFVEDAITRKDYEVMVLRDLMNFDLWLCHNDAGISTSIFKFGLWITKSAANWESTWEDSNWSDDVLWVMWRLLILYLLLIQDLSCCCLVNVSSSGNDPSVLVCVWWLVISTQRNHLLSASWR